jgi:D-3-phosphoglycerate dehydrogenase
MLDTAVTQLEIKFHGELTEKDVSPLTLAFLKGFLTPQVGDRVNYVNAALIAKERGIALSEVRHGGPSDYANLISVKTATARGRHSVAGTRSSIFGETIVNVDGFKLTAACEGLLLLIPNRDVPGMVAKIASYLGNKKINIAGMTVGRERIGGEARMILNVDDPVLPEDLNALGKLDNMLATPRQIKL